MTQLENRVTKELYQINHPQNTQGKRSLKQEDLMSLIKKAGDKALTEVSNPSFSQDSRVRSLIEEGLAKDEKEASQMLNDFMM